MMRSVTVPTQPSSPLSPPTRSMTLFDVPRIRDIQRVDPYSFAIGGFADIWKGRKDDTMVKVFYIESRRLAEALHPSTLSRLYAPAGLMKISS